MSSLVAIFFDKFNFKITGSGFKKNEFFIPVYVLSLLLSKKKLPGLILNPLI